MLCSSTSRKCTRHRMPRCRPSSSPWWTSSASKLSTTRLALQIHRILLVPEIDQSLIRSNNCRSKRTLADCKTNWCKDHTKCHTTQTNRTLEEAMATKTSWRTCKSYLNFKTTKMAQIIAIPLRLVQQIIWSLTNRLHRCHNKCLVSMGSKTKCPKWHSYLTASRTYKLQARTKRQETLSN